MVYLPEGEPGVLAHLVLQPDLVAYQPRAHLALLSLRGDALGHPDGRYPTRLRAHDVATFRALAHKPVVQDVLGHLG